MYERSIFWFRQDLRTQDNRGLFRAISESRGLLSVFILDTNLVERFGGFEDKKFWFLREVLLDVERQLQELGGSLLILIGKPEEEIPKLIQQYDIEAVYTNRSYGDYGIARDNTIESYCIRQNVEFFRESDFLLVEPEEVAARKVFTPFYKLWEAAISGVKTVSPKPFLGISHGMPVRDILDRTIGTNIHPYFSLQFLHERWENFDFYGYEDYRNDLFLDGTSRLSVYLRFGVISVRQLYLKVQGISESYVSELAWREFWQHIAYHFPYAKKREFQESKRNIVWKNNLENFKKWCEGTTGYPVVDAAMKQLLKTNWMHGRARMIVASFLTKDLLIDWRWGEKFFRQHLLDYDENVNIGNWQWSASVGADPKPLRIFSPMLQSEKFDPDAKFIRHYLPELEHVDVKSIHAPLESALGYAVPIVDHRIAQKEARSAYAASRLVS